MSGLDCLGVDDEWSSMGADDEWSAHDDVGFDYGGLAQATGGVLNYGVSAYEAEEKASKQSADDKSKLNAALAADAAASLANAQADVSAQTKSASASIDATAAQVANAAQDKAGSSLSDTSQKLRADAADKAVANAVKNAQAAPTDKYKQALVKAWQTTSNKAHSGAIAASDGSGKSSRGGGSSVFTLKNAGIAAAVVAGLGVLGFAVKKLFFK